MLRNKLFFIGILLILLFSCKSKIDTRILPDITKEEISGASLWKKITVESSYENYPMWPDHKGRQLGMSPHGRYHEVYINQKLLESVPNKERIAPYGSICVKKNFSAGNELYSVAAMVKVKDYDPANGDWFWAMYTPEGKVNAEGKIPFCYNCHAGSNNDYITIRKLDKPF